MANEQLEFSHTVVSDLDQMRGNARETSMLQGLKPLKETNKGNKQRVVRGDI